VKPGAAPGGLAPHGPRRRRASFALQIAAATLVAAIAAATPASADDVQFWPTVIVNASVHGGWKVSAEVQGRWSDDLETYNRTVYRLNGGLSLTPRLELLGGWELTAPATRAARREHRLWEQVEYTVRAGRWAFSNRGRLEQRFVSGADAPASRLRYRFRVQRPLGASKWTLGASEELWVHLTTVRLVGRRGVDQNRLGVTATRAVNQHLTIEPGYLYITPNLPDRQPGLRAHVATFQVTARF
jgi:hypothetical protein